jgi:KDO2-lipid IV(A) lauroyltransferase
MKFNKKYIRRKATSIIVYLTLGVTICVFRILPIRWIRRFAVFVGKLVYRLAHSSRKRTLANLESVYGKETTQNEREVMARKVFIEIVKSFMDYVAYSNLRNKERFFSLIEVVGEEHLQAAYDQGKGVICLVPHLSSWEFAAITPPMLGYETSAASSVMKMKLLQKTMVKFRASRGMKNIPRDGSYDKLVEVLRKGECLILMIDQDTKVKSVFVDFMGKQAYTPTGATRLAFETGAVIVPMVMTRKEDDNYRFIIYPELPLINTGNPEYDILQNTQRQTKIMEDMVRTYPTQWVWMHPRWRTTVESLEAYRKSKKESLGIASANNS